jgi:hypothetical protein
MVKGDDAPPFVSATISLGDGESPGVTYEGG